MNWDVKLRQINLVTGVIIKEFDVILGASNSVELAAIIGGAYRGDVHLVTFKPRIEGLQKITFEEKSDSKVVEVRLDNPSVEETSTESPPNPTPSEEFVM